MSPSSELSFVSRNIHNNLGGETCHNTTVRDKQLCQETFLVCLRPCPRERFPTISITHFKVDSSKATAVQHLFSQFDHSCRICAIVTNETQRMLTSETQRMHQLVLSSFFNSNRELILLSSEESRESLQHGMALQVNNPPQNDEHNEPQNDSGYGSGGFQPSIVFESRSDLDKLTKNHQELSQSCFYYGSIDSQSSRNLLRKKPIGTFLIRDSADSRYLYSLSVKTEKGATSIRILYKNGLFQFDSDERIRHKLPQFNSVLALLDFHVKVSEKGGNKLWRWEEISGSKSLMVDLRTPLKNSVPSLAHMSRVKINQCLENVEFPQLSIDKLPLDFADLKEFIGQYPYRI